MKDRGIVIVSAQKQSMAVPYGQPNSVPKKTFVLTIGLAIIVSFIAGTRSDEILGAVAPVLGFKVETGTLDLSSVQRTYQQLKANFDGRLDNQKLIDGASRGLTTAAGDQYTVFMDAQEAKQFDNTLTGQIGGGIGAEVGIRNGKPTIIRVLPGNPAETAGLQAGDVIIGINGENSTNWSGDQTVKKIRGEVGTTVKLAVLRGTATKDFTITRASVTNPSVRSEVKKGIGYLTISRFDGETSSLARKAAQTFKDQQVKKVILDLRDNGGGYLTAAQDVAGLWLDNQTVVSERTDDKLVDELKSGVNPLLVGLPTVVLVNGGSASASEVVAGALQDYKAATLIGEKTFGKGTVQKVIGLSGGAELKVTVARWYTPTGRNITKEGIEPNIKVGLTPDDINAGRDPQLTAAESFLNK